MNRKQIIETLNTKLYVDKLHSDKDVKDYNKATQYAIDHLSREWVSRKTHRKLIKMWENDCEEYVNQNIRVMVELKKNEDIIDELKADKDRLQTTLDKKFEEVESWRENSIKLESDWEKESDKVSELQTENKWLVIICCVWIIALLISLFTR